MEQLYSTSNADLVNHYQVTLQEIQKSPQGAAVAAYLLQTPSRNCRYFGALTYSVVILNNELNSGQVKDLVLLLHSHIQSLLSDEASVASNMFIIQKLFSDLLLIYTKYALANPNPILLFVHAITGTRSEEPLQNILGHLQPMTLELVLLFFSTLVEDIFRANSKSSTLHTAVFEDILPLLLCTYEYLLQLLNMNQLQDSLSIQSLKALTPWMSYISNVNAEIRYESTHVSILTQFVFLFFSKHVQWNENNYLIQLQLCLRILGDIFETNPALLTMNEKDAVASLLFDPGSWGFHFQNDIVLTDARYEHEEEINAYVDLVLSVLQFNTIKISKSILDPSTQNVIQNTLSLTHLNGASFEDDPTSERMLEFWEELTNAYTDSSEMFDALFKEKNDPQFQQAFECRQKEILVEVCRVYWRKIHLPSHECYTSSRAEFNSYRRAVADFFQVVYSFLKTELYSMLTDSLVLSTSTDDIEALGNEEAVLFLLFKINDDAVYFESQANALLPFSFKIMQSPVIEHFRKLAIDDPSNTVAVSTFVQYLSSNVFFFQTNEGSSYLGDVFDIIFSIIVSSNHTLSLLASKTATRICEKCSRHLVQFLPNLEVIIVEMLNNIGIDGLIRLRMFNAYTVVARTVDNEEQFGKILYGMVSQLRDTANIVLASIQESGKCSEIQEEYLVSLLLCLVGVAKGSALPDEVIDNLTKENAEAFKTFWLNDPIEIKPLVFSVLRAFLMENQVLRQMPIVVEKCTLVIRAGLGEELGGPFEFSPEVILDLVESIMKGLRNPNSVPHIFNLVECFITVNFGSLDTARVEKLSHLVFFNNMNFLKSDPDLLKGTIDVFAKFIDCKPELIVHSEFFVKFILPCAAEGLHANELFIIKSISKFWTGLLNLKKGTQVDQRTVVQLIELTWGHILTSNLVLSFLKAPRSNLEHFYAIFRSLLAKFPVKFKLWLIEVMQLEQVVSLAEPKERETFVNQLMLTRGRRAANDVLKAFWLKCNHLVEYNNQNF